MAPCQCVCLAAIVTLGIVTIVVLTMGDSGNADMADVDKEAINESKANSLRIRQGGVINITGLEWNSEGGVQDWHIGALVMAFILLIMGILGAWWLRRRCGRHNNQNIAQDFEMQQVPDNHQEHKGLHQEPEQMVMKQEQEGRKEDEGAKNEHGYELHAIGFLETQREINPIMMALRDSMNT